MEKIHWVETELKPDFCLTPNAKRIMDHWAVSLKDKNLKIQNYILTKYLARLELGEPDSWPEWETPHRPELLSPELYEI